MSFQNKLPLANYVFKKKDLDKMEKQVKDFFEKCIEDESLMILDKAEIRSFKWNDKKWEPLTELENMEIDNVKTKRSEEIKKKINSTIGIIDMLKNNLVFKIKKVGDKFGKKGLVCYQITKRQVIKNLNELIGKEKYTMENTLLLYP